MNIDLHIERLVLDGIHLTPDQHQRLQASLRAELARLLASGGLAPQLTAGSTLARLSTNSIQLVDSNPTHLGQQIAQSVYGGIGRG